MIRVHSFWMVHKRKVLVLLAALILGLFLLIPQSDCVDEQPPPSRQSTPKPVDLSGNETADQTPERPAEDVPEETRETGTVSGLVSFAQTGAVCVGAHVRLEWSGGIEPLAVVRSDGEGRYRIVGVLPGSYYIRLLTAASPQVWAEFHLRAGEVKRLDLKVPPGNARIHGRLTNKKTGEPIAGALVSTYPNELRRCVTGPDGRYEITGFGAEDTSVRSTAKGYVPASGRARSDEDGLDAEVNLEMERGRTIRGRVIGPDGEPVSGARVGLHQMYALEQTRHSHTTDANGEFTIEGVRAQIHVQVYAFHEDHSFGFTKPSLISKSEQVTVIDVRLPHPGTWEGRVIDPDGKPVPHASVRCWVTSEGEHDHVFHVPLAWTDGDGKYRLTGLPPGSCKASAWAEGFQPVEIDGLVLKEGGRLVAPDIVLVAAARIAGRIVDDLNRPVADARITAYPKRVETSPEVDMKALSDAEGYFCMADLPDGSYHIWVSKPCHVGIDRMLVKTSDPDLILTLIRGGSISGRVVFVGSNRGVQRFRIGLYDAESGQSIYRGAPEFTDAEGKFALDELPAGTYEIEAFAGDEWVSRRTVGLEIRKGDSPREVTLILQKGCEVTGRLQDSEGRPLTIATIQLLTPRGGEHVGRGGIPSFDPNAGVRPEKGGRFRIAPVFPGRYVLKAELFGHTGKLAVTVSRERECDVVLRLEKQD